MNISSDEIKAVATENNLRYLINLPIKKAHNTWEQFLNHSNSTQVFIGNSLPEVLTEIEEILHRGHLGDFGDGIDTRTSRPRTLEGIGNITNSELKNYEIRMIDAKAHDNGKVVIELTVGRVKY